MEKYYKNRYALAFYTRNDDLVLLANNMDDVAAFLDMDRSSQEFKTLKARISNAVHKNCTLGSRYMLIGNEYCRPYLIDMVEDRDEEILL